MSARNGAGKGSGRGTGAPPPSKGKAGRFRATVKGSPSKLAPVVDLARERRISAAVAELRDLVDGGAVDEGRTRAMLAGTLEARAVSDPADVSTTLRLPAALLARADELAARLTPPPGGRVSRSNVLRAALERGLSAMETDAGPVDGGSVATAPDLRGLLAELDALRAKVAGALALPGVE